MGDEMTLILRAMPPHDFYEPQNFIHSGALRPIAVMRKSPQAKAAEKYTFQSVLIELQARFPKAFPVPPKKPRILWPECLAELPGALSDRFGPGDIKIAVRRYTNRPAYLKALTTTTWFRDLEGHRVAMILPWVKAEAEKRLGQMDEKERQHPAPTIVVKRRKNLEINAPSGVGCESEPEISSTGGSSAPTAAVFLCPPIKGREGA